MPLRHTFVPKYQYADFTTETVAENFGIGPDQARAILRPTIHRGTKLAALPITQRYCADIMFEVPQLISKFITDIIRADTTSSLLNVESQIYTHMCGFNTFYHMSRAHGYNVVNLRIDFIHEFGTPDHLTFDGVAV